MARQRESRRIGQVILLSLGTPVVLVSASWALGAHPLAFVLLLYLSPLVVIVSLFVFGWLLVGPYRPHAHLTVAPANRPPMPSRSPEPFTESGAADLARARSGSTPPAPRTPTIKPVASRR